MYGLIGKIKVVPGKRDELISILIEGAAGMPGCLSYIVAQDSTDPDAIWVTEVWDSPASHQASLSLAPVQGAIARGRSLIAGFGERFETVPVGGHGLSNPGRRFMMNGVELSEPTSSLPKRRAIRFGITACGWSIAFAALSFYWALGGTAGSETIGPGITDLAQDPIFIMVLWATTVLKVLLGLLALALIWYPARGILRWMLLAAGWAAGAGMILYGGASFIQHALMLTGAVHLPAGLGEMAARWHLLLWDPWWTLGGVLFAATAWYASQIHAVKTTPSSWK